MIVKDPETQTKAIFAIRDLDLTKPHEVKISEYKANKTLEQLRLYWKWVDIIAKEYGEHKNDMSEFLKQELIKPQFVDVKGKVRSVRPSVSKMKIGEMAAYMNDVSVWASCQGLSLPHPEDLHSEQ